MVKLRVVTTSAEVESVVEVENIADAQSVAEEESDDREVKPKVVTT